MIVSKLGDGLVVRLPDPVVEALELKEGDNIEILIADARTFDVERIVTPDEWLVRMRRLRGMIPADFKFDREEANAR